MVQTEQGTKVDRLVSIDIAERFEALQDEVDLLKVEVKQTLVDLREFIIKGSPFSPRGSRCRRCERSLPSAIQHPSLSLRHHALNPFRTSCLSLMHRCRMNPCPVRRWKLPLHRWQCPSPHLFRLRPVMRWTAP